MPRPSPSRAAAVLAAALLVAAPRAHAQNGYVQTNLVSDIPGLARTTDPLLVNPWGVSFSGTSPFWVSNGGTGTSTLYNGAGVKSALTVTIPGPGAPGVPSVPTGQVFNSAGPNTFVLANGQSANFLFASATGTISGWNGAAGTNAVRVVNEFPTSSYTGLALAGSGTTARLYAANFGRGSVDVFDRTFARINNGGFVDPTIPAGYAPFNVHTVGSSIFVTYAQKDPVTGRATTTGTGFVDVYDLDGTLQRRLTGGPPLNAPWGIALAPTTFGSLGGALLVGNFGNGRIDAFDFATGTFRGVLSDGFGTPIVNEGLWEIAFGNGVSGDANTLYFAAGIQDETHGLFGAISTVPEPGTVFLVATGLGGLMLGAARRRRTAAG